MLIKFLIAVVAVLYFAVNVWTTASYNPADMRERYVEGQCNVGKISAAIFYAPAWFLKLFKSAVVRLIK